MSSLTLASDDGRGISSCESVQHDVQLAACVRAPRLGHLSSSRIVRVPRPSCASAAITSAKSLYIPVQTFHDQFCKISSPQAKAMTISKTRRPRRNVCAATLCSVLLPLLSLLEDSQNTTQSLGLRKIATVTQTQQWCSPNSDSFCCCLAYNVHIVNKRVSSSVLLRDKPSDEAHS